MNLLLQYAHHDADEFETQKNVSTDDILRAFDKYDWAGETARAEVLQGISPTLRVEADADVLIYFSSIPDDEHGLIFISECHIPVEVRSWFGFSKKIKITNLHTIEFNLHQARQALSLFLAGAYPELRELY